MTVIKPVNFPIFTSGSRNLHFVIAKLFRGDDFTVIAYMLCEYRRHNVVEEGSPEGVWLARAPQ